MSQTSIPIFTDAGSNTVRLTFKLTARQANGEPLAGEECTVTLEGDGSLAPRHDAKRILRLTNSQGTAEIVWYRRGIYGRDVRATLQVEAPAAGATLALEASAPASA